MATRRIAATREDPVELLHCLWVELHFEGMQCPAELLGCAWTDDRTGYTRAPKRPRQRNIRWLLAELLAQGSKPAERSRWRVPGSPHSNASAGANRVSKTTRPDGAPTGGSRLLLPTDLA